LKKKITIIGVNYFPEDTAIGLYSTQLAEHFNSNDYEVTVITGFPYYPSWKIFKSYKNKSTFLKEKVNGVNIIRYKQYVPQNPTFFNRILHILDFTFGGIVNLFKVKKTDVVLCIVPFTSSVFLGKLLSKFKKAKLWVHIQDFEFDAAAQSEIISNKKKDSLVFKILFRIEKYLLNSADIRSTISLSMLNKLNTKSLKESNIMLPNWVDVENINPKKHKKHKYLQSDTFKILYSGNIGEKQDWSFFIEFVNSFQNDKSVEIIIVGDGSKRKWLTECLNKHTNVNFYYPVEYCDLSDLLCSADLHVLFQKTDVLDTVMPSKILAMMASEKPSLITGNKDSEVARIIKKSNGGEFFHTKNIEPLINYVLYLRENKSIAEIQGKSARKFVSASFSKKKVLQKFQDTADELIQS